MAATTTITPSAPHLSSNDSAVLQALFDAESSLSNTSTGIHLDSSLSQQLPGISPAELSRLQALERAAIIPLQAETGTGTIRDAHKIRAAVAKLTAIIEENKGYASAYVNRAQAARMLVESGMDGKKEKEKEEQGELANMIFADLSTAISLLSPSPSSPPPSSSSTSQHFSPLHARILANAHTHRAYILYRASRALDSNPPPPSSNSNNPPSAATLTTLPVHLHGKSAQHLEEMASMDFQLGGRYGNEIARQMAVKTNPYAKMCGAIVKEAMRKEMMVGQGEGDGFVV
ncbi:hypothetical protein EMPG_17447 [Blastomyces silverae]|uniref:Uncharacterized protein n=1 Tax=Blastomyces silverae TaxID=2060906 RepID=A0A0H1B7I0_9EURO|nr:hypothetical protein EMPG_17447 [Blastomyces silverae]